MGVNDLRQDSRLDDVNDRLERQTERINEDVEEGQLTPHEAH
jgi:hypothetical protein